jgi:hypothetical protein
MTKCTVMFGIWTNFRIKCFNIGIASTDIYLRLDYMNLHFGRKLFGQIFILKFWTSASEIKYLTIMDNCISFKSCYKLINGHS